MRITPRFLTAWTLHWDSETILTLWDAKRFKHLDDAARALKINEDHSKKLLLRKRANSIGTWIMGVALLALHLLHAYIPVRAIVLFWITQAVVHEGLGHGLWREWKYRSTWPSVLDLLLMRGPPTNTRNAEHYLRAPRYSLQMAVFLTLIFLALGYGFGVAWAYPPIIAGLAMSIASAIDFSPLIPWTDAWYATRAKKWETAQAMIRNVFLDLDVQAVVKHAFVKLDIEPKLMEEIMSILFRYREDLKTGFEKAGGRLRNSKPNLPNVINDAFRASTSRRLFILKKYLGDARTLADIGAGTGDLSYRLVENIYGLIVIAADINRASWKNWVHMNLEFRHVKNSAKLPYLDAEVDSALLINTLHHIEASGFPHLASELSRILKPQGRLIIVDNSYPKNERGGAAFFALNTDQRRLAYAFAELIGHLLIHPDGMPMAFHFESLVTWATQLAEAGFDTLRSDYLTPELLGSHELPRGVLIMEKIAA